MRSSALTAILLGAASASASTFFPRQDSYPTCALSCIADPDLGACTAVTDTHCLCTDNTFVTSTTKCIEDACTGQDLQDALTVSQSLCLAVGVTLTASIASATDSATATATDASSSESVSATATAPASVSTSGSSSTSSAASSSAAAATTSASSSAAGASHEVNALLGLVAAGLAFVAL